LSPTGKALAKRLLSIEPQWFGYVHAEKLSGWFPARMITLPESGGT
jgi:hypothetical protein